ncbi:hypothetical protein RYZ27_12750 [Hyphomonas sp. FCG-A18]|jgi:hypothetical protein|uniref:hypothetical protein n=1 Tax=Hyphomonas sp. FCG-A18 TaxID=3080019 RepID=UPI002B31EE2B|nr:hypothetical protein RYZ27_12750 [Hyphomonas sp. FCG-A18]
MTLKRVVLRLARNEGYPEGDDSQGYVLVAPLTADGLIDLDEWRENREACTVDRFHPDPDEKADGWLTHRGSHWRFRYDEEDEGPDEGGYRLGEHRFRPGEYVTIAHHGEDPLTYIVTDVTKV